MADVVSANEPGGADIALELKVQATILASVFLDGRHPGLPGGIAETSNFKSDTTGRSEVITYYP